MAYGFYFVFALGSLALWINLLQERLDKSERLLAEVIRYVELQNCGFGFSFQEFLWKDDQS